MQTDKKSLMAMGAVLATAVAILMDSLRPVVLTWRGSASGFPVTVRAQGWILAGHCEHHLSILKITILHLEKP